MARAVLYARKSNPDEPNVEHQHQRLEAACDRAGWNVAAAFIDDGASGWKRDAKRPGFEAAVKYAVAEGIDYLLVTEVDRLARINSHGVVALEYADVRVVEVDDDGDVRKLRWAEVYDKVGKARDESDVKSRRQLQAEDRRIDDGKPSRGGHRHFGYHGGDADRCGCGDPDACVRHAIRDDEATILRDVAERWLAGEAMRALARDLQKRGVPTVRGGEWTRTGLRKTLMSPRLAGIRVHRRDGEVREVRLKNWEQVFSDDLHARLVAADGSSGNRRAPQRYLLTGLIVCGRCDATLNGKHGADRRRYACLGCSRNGIGADPVDAAVWNAALARRWDEQRLDREKAARSWPASRRETRPTSRNAASWMSVGRRRPPAGTMGTPGCAHRGARDESRDGGAPASQGRRTIRVRVDVARRSCRDLPRGDPGGTSRRPRRGRAADRPRAERGPCGREDRPRPAPRRVSGRHRHRRTRRRLAKSVVRQAHAGGTNYANTSRCQYRPSNPYILCRAADVEARTLRTTPTSGAHLDVWHIVIHRFGLADLA